MHYLFCATLNVKVKFSFTFEDPVINNQNRGSGDFNVHTSGTVNGVSGECLMPSELN